MKRSAAALVMSVSLALQPAYATLLAQAEAANSSAAQAIPNADLCVQASGDQVALGVAAGGNCVSDPSYGAGFPTNLTYASITTLSIPAFSTSFYASGYATAGDLGRGMPMVVGSSSGALARQSIDGRWWNLDVPALAAIPVGFCGAVADDATDNTTAFQVCAGIANAANKSLAIIGKGGTFRVGRSGSAPSGVGGWVRLDTGTVGDGGFRSYIRNMAKDDNLFYAGNYTAASYRGVDYLNALNSFGAAVLYSGGATIVIDAASTSTINQNFSSVVEGNSFELQNIGVNCLRCNIPRIENNYFSTYQVAGVELDNINNGDNGDQIVSKNTFDAGANTAAVGVLQTGGGGLRMSDNKVGRGAAAFRLRLRQGVTTSILKIHDNSFEGQTGSAVDIALASGVTSASFIGAEVVDNEIATNSTSPAIEIDGAGYLVHAKVRGNRLFLLNAANVVGTNVTGGLGLDYGDNIIDGYNLGATALVIGSGVSGRVGSDTLIGVPVALRNTSLQVSLTTELIRLFPDVGYYAKPALSGLSSSEATLGTGYSTLSAFVVTMPAYGKALIEIDIDGFTQGFGGSVFRQRWALLATASGINVTPFAASADIAPTPPGNTTSAQGWTADATVSGLSVTFNVHEHATANGSCARTRMRIIGGNATFQSIQ